MLPEGREPSPRSAPSGWLTATRSIWSTLIAECASEILYQPGEPRGSLSGMSPGRGSPYAGIVEVLKPVDSLNRVLGKNSLVSPPGPCASGGFE